MSTFGGGEDLLTLNREIFNQIRDKLENKENIMLSGLDGSAKAYFLQTLMEGQTGKIICLVETEEKAYDLARDLQALTGRDDRVFLFLSRDYVFIKENKSGALIQRVLCLQDLVLHPRRRSIIIATPGAFLHYILSPEETRKKTLAISAGEETEREPILKILAENDYQRVETVFNPGEFALRGGLLDLYPIGAKTAYRLEFFGDFVDTMREMDPDTQRSGAGIKSLTVFPGDDLSGNELHATLLDYLDVRATIWLEERTNFFRTLEKQRKKYQDFVRELSGRNKEIKTLIPVDLKTLEQQLSSARLICHSFFPPAATPEGVSWYRHISQREMEPFYHHMDLLFRRLQEWQEKNYSIFISVKNKKLEQELALELEHRNIKGIDFWPRELSRGFVSPTLEMAVLGQENIWGKKSRKKSGRSAGEKPHLQLEELKKGDYVVHENHGVGVFRGITQAETDGYNREYILIQYAGSDKLYLPVDKIYLLYKYSSSGEKEPRLSKLGGVEWDKTRRRVSASIQEMAGELLQLYAARETLEGYAFAPDTPWQKQFEDEFPHQETPDQLKAIAEVKSDMEKTKPMDRLVCGDVGYGKTEVAMRAAFKAVMDGKQVAILVPTTILAEQHYHSFTRRFSNYPTQIDVLSRFRKAGEQKKIKEGLSRGSIDIIIGTHRLLSRDIVYKDLGLLVIDEEHRFGVAQKEKIKNFKKTVDVMSLSATPIPRSLHMSLAGLRDLSIIETPPPERYPITTYVLEYNEEVIREAVQQEVERGGQVFFVHNRIRDIYRVQRTLQEMLPGLRIALGHGRMEEEELSRTMLQFAAGNYDLLLSTAIIESGLDMPNVNTIIIDEAHKMGLAQLYQLRGRVGRSSRIAYAFITYRREQVVKEVAQKRLNALREFHELGAGLKIALRDLEIRGAGNILGPEQHGYIQAVGFDLYCNLLEAETARLKGGKPSSGLHPQVDVDLDYYIPDHYIGDSGSKMRIYRRLMLADQAGEIAAIREEMVDRYGPLPAPVDNFLKIAGLRLEARNKSIKSIRRRGNTIEIETVSAMAGKLASSLPGYQIRVLNPHKFSLQLKSRAALEVMEQVIARL